jgi:hypothetical protein
MTCMDSGLVSIPPLDVGSTHPVKPSMTWSGRYIVIPVCVAYCSHTMVDDRYSKGGYAILAIVAKTVATATILTWLRENQAAERPP